MDVQLKMSDADLLQLAGLVAERLASLLAGQVAAEPSTCKKRLYTERETADLLGVSVFSLKKWRQQGVLKAATSKRPILYTPELIDEAAKRLGERGATTT